MCCKRWTRRSSSHRRDRWRPSDTFRRSSGCSRPSSRSSTPRPSSWSRPVPGPHSRRRPARRATSLRCPVGISMPPDVEGLRRAETAASGEPTSAPSVSVFIPGGVPGRHGDRARVVACSRDRFVVRVPAVRRDPAPVAGHVRVHEARRGLAVAHRDLAAVAVGAVPGVRVIGVAVRRPGVVDPELDGAGRGVAAGERRHGLEPLPATVFVAWSERLGIARSAARADGAATAVATRHVVSAMRQKLDRCMGGAASLVGRTKSRVLSARTCPARARAARAG